MTVKYYAILTNQGAARLANATMLGSKLNLTQMAVGDANGVLPTPDPAQTKLINQKRIAPLNLLSVDPNNQSQIIAEQIIPENEGGFWIREIGLYDDEGVLIAVANCPETYKPQLQEGSGRTQTIRMILVVSNTEAITLKIDPSVVLATRKYVDDEVLELRLYVDDQMRNHIAAQDPHTQYAQKHNPTFTGEPKAPTPAAGNNTTRIATTAFVQAAITALINGAPATLDTLKEIAAAINNDPKFSTTINNALSGKQPLDETLTHLSGKDVAGLLAYLGIGETGKYDILPASRGGTGASTIAGALINFGLSDLVTAGLVQVESGTDFITAKIPFLSGGRKRFLMIHAIKATMPANNNGYNLTVTFPTAYDNAPIPILGSTVGSTSTTGGTTESMNISSVTKSGCIISSAWQTWSEGPVYLLTIGGVAA
ncbi:TPA: phage tail protein [Escherichia coli]|uniref:phage tail protein n=1 Tax=Escherichia coli TaxID=562 RepID=UPI000DA536B2|nr:phage tail protein [Escherichia coli]EJT0112949.1 phage tail protein [Salmonella enterica subsp. enterica serovar 4:i:-]MCV8668227.1 phage tail protein [Escherichia coli]SQO06754.1 phage tail fiber protein [Escherichia coli]HEI2497667.1 phage tail protein [Escherichia coli]